MRGVRGPYLSVTDFHEIVYVMQGPYHHMKMRTKYHMTDFGWLRTLSRPPETSTFVRTDVMMHCTRVGTVRPVHPSTSTRAVDMP